MLWSLFFLLFGDTIMALLAALALNVRYMAIDSPMDPADSTFIEQVDFMFPENFLSRYPHEAHSWRLKIFAYLIFNLLIKGYGSVDPGSFWSNYNHNNFYRTAIDAVFYEYLTNFTDGGDKDSLFDLLESRTSNRLVSGKEIAVDRIGKYLDSLSQTESQPERLKEVYNILSRTNVSPVAPDSQEDDCGMEIPTSGTPGIDYPNFCDIPETSFKCAGNRIPGIYADYETGCQVFHVCWPHRIDSFLCPIGTTFNQTLLMCDYWHDTGCYSSPLLFKRDHFTIDGVSTANAIPEYDGTCESLLNKPLRLHIKFLPVKCGISYLDDEKQTKVEAREKHADELGERLEIAYNLVKEMLDMLAEIRNELSDEIRSRGIPQIHVLAKRLKLNTEPNADSLKEAVEFKRRIGESDFEPTTVDGQLNNSGKSSNPSQSPKVHVKSSRKEDVPDIVMESLSLGGNILNEGVIPLTKQLIMDSYRKIRSNKH